MSLKINFYCDEKYKNAIPEPIAASKIFPKWYSRLPLVTRKFKFKTHPDNIYKIITDFGENNVKKCLGIQEFLSTGYIIPSWADFIFREEENGGLYVNWIDNFFDEIEYKSHPNCEYETMPNKPIYNHFGKIYTPWSIKTDSGVSCLITHPVWHRNNTFTSATAVIHTDVTPLQLAWFFEWNYKIKTQMSLDNFDIENQVVPKGEPIILVIPYYRKKFTSHVNYVSSTKYNSLIKSQHHVTHTTIGGHCPYKNFRKNLGKLFT